MYREADLVIPKRPSLKSRTKSGQVVQGPKGEHICLKRKKTLKVMTLKKTKRLISAQTHLSRETNEPTQSLLKAFHCNPRLIPYSA